MTIPQVFGVLSSLAVLIWTLTLVRRAVLSERFAAVWLTVSVVSLTLAVWPDLLYGLTHLLHFALPVNLLFVGSALVQLLVSIQLSIEVGRRQSETRRLAEEVALLQIRVRELSRDPEHD